MSISKPIFIINVLLLAIFLTVFPGLAQNPSPTSPLPDASPFFVPGEILVKFRPHVGSLDIQDTLRANEIRSLQVSRRGGIIRCQVTPGREAETIAALLAQRNVEFATYNHYIQALNDPNDPSYGLQWALHQAGDHDIDAPEAWDIHTGSSNVTIAVLDTGVDLDHPDLQANIVAGYDFVNNDTIPDDDNGHGTHVAGIAAAVANNGKGIAGVSWGAKIMPLKVLSSGGGGSSFNLADSVYYAVDNGAKVINMSLGGSDTKWPCGWPHIDDAFDYALDHNVLLVAASGNTSQNGVNCPAAYHQAIAVGSTTSGDTLSYFSNYGPRLDIAAPGNNIYSTMKQGNYGYKSGTSMATSYVSGLAALLWSFSPDLPHNNIRNIIEVSAEDLGSAGWDQFYGHGRINARRALEALVSLQTSPAQISILVDDDSNSVPVSRNIRIISANSNIVAWTATISPPVSWLNVFPPVSGTISTASSPVVATLVATRPSTYGLHRATVVITGTNSSGSALGIRSAEVYANYIPGTKITMRLPLILKTKAHGPDLVIKNLVVIGNAMTVTVKNQGDATVNDAFWVDTYFNPRMKPGLNQPWNTIANHGVVWGVTTPIAANGILTLTVGDAYYRPEYSSSLPLPGGSVVYALADSINFSANYGAVQESDESNNLLGPTVSAASVTGEVTLLTANHTPPVSEEGLPGRR